MEINLSARGGGCYSNLIFARPTRFFFLHPRGNEGLFLVPSFGGGDHHNRWLKAAGVSY